MLSLQGKGIPHLDRHARGSVHIVVDIEVPKRLSKRAKKLLEELEQELSEGGEARAEA